MHRIPLRGSPDVSRSQAEAGRHHKIQRPASVQRFASLAGSCEQSTQACV
ncbi:unnamed protein product [Musa acuminata var. zebrina]